MVEFDGALQLVVTTRASKKDVGIPIGNHVFIATSFQVGIQVMLGLEVVGAQEYVVMVSAYGESTLKQRFLSISPHRDSCPSCRHPATVMTLNPRFTPEHPMIKSVDGLCPFDLAILVQVGHGGALSNNVMIWLKGKLNLLLALMKIKDEVEIGQCMYAMGGGSDLRILNQRQICDWLSTLRPR